MRMQQQQQPAEPERDMRTVTMREAARELGCSVRTVYRDTSLPRVRRGPGNRCVGIPMYAIRERQRRFL